METTGTMNSAGAQSRRIHWPLGIGLGAMALLRPLTRIAESVLGVHGSPVVPIAITLAITITWTLVIGLRRGVNAPLTGLVAGLSYGVLAIVLSGIVSPLVDGYLDGPLAHPIAIVPMLAVNAVWGLLAGLLAMAVQAVRFRGNGPPAGKPTHTPTHRA